MGTSYITNRRSYFYEFLLTMETASEKFTLKWSQFETTTRESLKALHAQDHLTDVTLLSADDQQINAHKVVLSGSSPYFQRVLTKNPNDHPLLFMNGINMDVLKAIVAFIYLGEVQVEQDKLEAFMAGATELEVKGLQREDVGELDENVDPASANGVSDVSNANGQIVKDEPTVEDAPTQKTQNATHGLKYRGKRS